MKEPISKPEFGILHKRTEEEFKRNQQGGKSVDSDEDRSLLIHEIEGYKSELKKLREELRGAKEETDYAVKKYYKLLDLHNRFILHMIKSHQNTVQDYLQ